MFYLMFKEPNTYQLLIMSGSVCRCF